MSPIVARLRAAASSAQDGGTELMGLLEEAAAEIEHLQAAVQSLEVVVAELAAEAKRSGVKTETLDLWAAGKLVGGQGFRVGGSTPKTCAMIAGYRDWKREQMN